MKLVLLALMHAVSTASANVLLILIPTGVNGQEGLEQLLLHRYNVLWVY